MGYKSYLDVKYANPFQEELIEEMRQKLAKQFGVTVVGQFVTVRWYDKDQERLQSVTMVITDADAGYPDDDDDHEDK